MFATRLRSQRDRDPDERNFRMHLAARGSVGDDDGVDDDGGVDVGVMVLVLMHSGVDLAIICISIGVCRGGC